MLQVRVSSRIPCIHRRLWPLWQARKPLASRRGYATPSESTSELILGSNATPSQSDKERVVILGSGWAGYTLARMLDPKKYQPIVISPRSYFVFTPLLASTAVGTLEFRVALEPIRSKRTHANFLQGWADSVDFKNKTVQVEEAVDDPLQAQAPTEGMADRPNKGEIINVSYDKLVVAVGCYMQTFSTPGVREHALFLKDVGDARKIRRRLLSCFENASLPTTTEDMKRNLLNFAIVGGGPTGIEFSAELHDMIKEDMSRLYPDLVKYCKVSVYDVAPRVLSMFDEKLSGYAMEKFSREGIQIKTNHHIQSLRRGVPSTQQGHQKSRDDATCWTLTVKEEGEVGVGMVVWSTGLMMNPFVDKALAKSFELPDSDSAIARSGTVQDEQWLVKKHSKSGGVLTNERLQVMLQASNNNDATQNMVLPDVYALGDCAGIENAMYPTTAQVASQKATWLAKRLNRGDIEQSKFTYKSMGVMAYIGDWNAIMQTDGGDVSGRLAWIIWRTAYIAKAVSLRNKLLIPIYWVINWLFGRDISRF